MSLRSTVVATTVVVTALAVAVAAALIILTTTLHRTTVGAVESVESVRLAQDARIALANYERALDATVPQASDGTLAYKLEQAELFVATEEEAEVLDRARAAVAAYVAAAHDPAIGEAELERFEQAAEAALAQLTAINVVQAKLAQEDAARWDRLGNVIGTAAVLLLLAVAGGLLVWLRGRAFQPIFELAASMERFGRGDHDARAAELGPQELREMCRRFNEMASAIAAQRHAQMAFLGGVAHDLRNPLSNLQMGVVLLLSDPSLRSDANHRQALERIARQITRMDRMIGDFLDGARVEAGALELRVEVHDARVIVQQAVELFDGVSSGHTLEMELPDHNAPICCDRLRIEQVLINLISNAIKYSPAGGAIEIALRSHASELELSVRDHGVGIRKHEQENMFEPFRRVGLSSSQGVPGVGLGLYVVRKLVEAHRGRIEVDSVPGEGSTFRVFLPLTGTG